MPPFVTASCRGASKQGVAAELDDKQLVSAVLAGERQAFETLVRKYEKYVMTLTLRYVRNRVQAEELAQDVFLKAYRSLPGFEGKCRFSTWLYAIVNSVCISHLRKAGGPGDGYDDHYGMISDSTGIEEIIAGTDRQHWQLTISQALEKIPPEEQRVVTLFYQAEQTVQEIASITGWSSSNVKIKLFRARQKLRKLLEHAHKEFQS